MENRILSDREVVSSLEVMNLENLLEHWQGHRRLTRKLIESFPEEHLYTFSIGGMRTSADLIMELIGLASPGINGVVTGVYTSPLNAGLDYSTPAPETKLGILALWDRVTDQMNETWQNMTVERTSEVEAAFGMYENTVVNTIFYLIDNEIHHRAQAYVYMRALGHEPPAFWDRA
ncbi:damage-inducible protein DinB [Dyadobacter luteus]|uniref:Damage-inducible protein DinB n=1 Tax=Dyadobacter luteus TaxID=2259619 RepID=A0A3D8Y2Q9_9BACT|nr:DinB family protein [Dyadobacter luteus]REA55969.1 damage-inducible protein DinB [Dyadobacter luteus]